MTGINFIFDVSTGKNLQKALDACQDKNILADLKLFIALFCTTLGGYGYNVTQLQDMLLNVRCVCVEARWCRH